MKEYNFSEIEKKWQQYWRDHAIYKVTEDKTKPKCYVLDMFPYPSGAGLHVGHPLGYIASDIYARYKRLKGFNVLHPMGYDAFGLPAEQYAIQTGQHPAITTEQNLARYREQLDKIGFSYDWDREVRTSDPNYYKWTQWMFIKLFHSFYNSKTDKAEPIENLISVFEKSGLNEASVSLTGNVEHELKSFTAAEWKEFDEKKQQEILMKFRMAYLAESYVNWCPQLGTVLANDEVKDGVSERGGYPVERKLMMQWSLRITAYADRLLNGLNEIDWTESLKEAQRNWIGKSEGCSITFRLIPGPSPKEKGVTLNYQTADKRIWSTLKDHAKENRKEPTKAEEILWQSLRDNRIGYKIRRQHPIETFIADFICIPKRVVIEVDGGIHDNEEQREFDIFRTKQIEAMGYSVIRFNNEEVINQTELVTQKIKKYLDAKVLSFGEDLGEALSIEVFTTRPDTIFGVSFVTLAPEHELVEKITTPDRKDAVMQYVAMAKNRSERERMADVKKISGEFTGAYVTHPFTGKQVPVWVGDYVLAGYGTGAVMAVPAHDSRDFAFAKHFGLERPVVIMPSVDWDFADQSYDDKNGKCVNSDFLDGLETKAAIKKAIAEIEKQGLGKGKTNYRLRDAIFGRQRYWGEPIPIYYKDGIAKTVDEKDLPVILPEIDKYLPTETGEPPLARATNWRHTPDPSQEWKAYPLELSTMPGWAGSSWYFLRYMDPKNAKEFANKEAIDYWKQIDLYLGGNEHATGHLLYFRFWTKFLYDLGLIPFDEPAKKLINQGMIQGVSSFAYRFRFGYISDGFEIGTQLFISKGIVDRIDESEIQKFIGLMVNKIIQRTGKVINLFREKHEVLSQRVDISFVNKNSELDIDSFRNWYPPQFTDSEFILEDDNCNPTINLNEGKYICGSEVEKMSKSKYNVVTPDSIVEEYGADTLRLYEMFLGPLEQSKPWSTQGIEGVHRFLKKLWKLFYNAEGNLIVTDDDPAKKDLPAEASAKAGLKSIHKLIKKVGEDVEGFSFNTSVSSFMICVNELTDLKCNKKKILSDYLICLSPYAPHIAEELWNAIGNKDSITNANFPLFNPDFLIEDSFSYPISINGKHRTNIEMGMEMPQHEVEKLVMNDEIVLKWLEGKQPKKIVFVKGRIVNVVA